jgi:acyl-CoA synthetase (AMP-forming)/AMP-acid ligase II
MSATPPHAVPDAAAPARGPLFVEQVRAHARQRPNDLATRAPGGERSWAELVARSERIAARLRECGCEPSDRIVILGRPSIQWLDVMLGAMFARCAAAPLSTALTAEEQALLLADARPRLVFADREFIRMGACPADRTVALEELDSWAAAGPGAGAPATPSGEDLFSIIYSSGTTGVPKGIAHTAQARADFVAARTRSGLQYVATSLYTNFSFLGLIGPLFHGAAVTVAAKFSVEGFLEAAAAEGVTNASLVPVQVRRILEHPAFDPAKLASLKFTMLSGSPVEPETKARLVAVWPGAIVDSYGTTETGGVATLDLKANPDRLDTVGKIMPGVEVVMLDEDGAPLPAGATGEIAARTPMPMEGYYNRDDLTEGSVWRDGQGRRFIRTGDVGRVDDDGFLHITGRAKDMIISGGLNIFASDIEDALRRHEAVAESAVVAVPDPQWGERPYAFVVLREGGAVEPEALLEWLNARVAKTSRLVGLDLTPELPRNDMGKVLKRVLREPFWRDRDRDVA